MIIAEKENACAPEKGIQFKTFDILTVNRPGVDYILNFYSITMKALSICLPEFVSVFLLSVYAYLTCLFARLLFHSV
jgi:hypothetical protein